jgi:hypothetical protein
MISGIKTIILFRNVSGSIRGRKLFSNTSANMPKNIGVTIADDITILQFSISDIISTIKTYCNNRD